ncbi:MAG: hypothetical protein DBX59_11180 [Bacillota bacterium]|nr:MAG: hypothetical protein DBX59_11180 [Bacillota bacterium]
MNKLFKNKILLLLIVAALGCFSAFFVSCNASLNETDNSQTETPDEDGETQKPADPSEEAFMWALSGVLGYGAEGELSLDLGGERIRGTVRADFSESLLAFVDLDIKGTKVSLGMQAADGQKLVLAELFGEKLYFDLDDLPEVAYRISALADETLPPVEDGAYPPFVIGGTDVGALLSVLDEFNAYTLISLMNGADIVGTPAENGGYDYRFALGDAFSADLWVDGERALKTVSLRVAAGETEISLALENIAYPETPIAAKPAEEYKNLKNYLVLIESFCKEKIESVPALIETIKNFDFGKAGQLIAAVAQNKSVAFDVALTVQNTPIAAAVTLDFANGFKASVAAEVAGAEIALYYAEDTLYLNAGAIALQCSLETVGEILSMFGVERTALADLPALLKNFAAGIEIEYISAEGDKIYAGVSGLEIEFDTKTFSLKISSEAFSAQLNALAAGGRVDVPAAEYSDAAHLLPVAKALIGIVESGGAAIDGAVSAGGTEITLGNVRVSLKPFGLSGNVGVAGMEFAAVFAEDKLYLSGDNFPAVSLDSAALLKILLSVSAKLPSAASVAVSDILGFVESFSADESGLLLQLNLQSIGAGKAQLSVSAENGGVSVQISSDVFDAELLAAPFAGTVEPPVGHNDISGFIKAADLDYLMEVVSSVMEAKSLGGSISLNMPALSLEGDVTLDFADGLKAAVGVTLGGSDIRLFYADNVIYLLKDGVALSATGEEIESLLKLFGADAKGAVDLSSVNVYEEDGKLKIALGGAVISVDGETMRVGVSYGDMVAELDRVGAGDAVVVPAAEYSEFAAIGEVAESLYKMIGGMKFEVAGSFDLNGTQIVFENARVYSTGDGRDLTADFNSGKISLGGTLLVGGTHKIQVSFDGTNMYLCYNDAMKVVMSKSSLDVVAKVLKENFAFILDGFVKADELTDMVNAKDYGAIVSALRSLKSYRDEAQLPVVELEIGLGDGAIGLVLRKTAENGVGVTLAENQTFTITKSDVSEAPVTAPADADVYMNLSDISYLADAFFKTANKNVFKLSGDIKVNLNVLGIKADLSVGLEANVRINKNAEGRITGVDAYVVFDNTRVAKKGSQDVENTTVSAIHDLALKYGKSVITFTGDTLYIDRMNMKKSLETVSWWPIKSGYQFAETAYEHKKIAAADCTGDALKDLIFYALGVNTNLVNMFKFDGTPDIASALGGYSSGNVVNGVPQEHNVTLNLAALTGSDMFKPSTFRIAANAENLLVGLNVEELLIDFGVGTVKVGLSAENDLDGVLDESCFEEYLNNEYQPFI